MSSQMCRITLLVHLQSIKQSWTIIAALQTRYRQIPTNVNIAGNHKQLKWTYWYLLYFYDVISHPKSIPSFSSKLEVLKTRVSSILLSVLVKLILASGTKGPNHSEGREIMEAAIIAIHTIPVPLLALQQQPNSVWHTYSYSSMAIGIFWDTPFVFIHLPKGLQPH